MSDSERIRFVILGGPRVGKSAIVKQFLFNTFPEKYKPTVEDLYSKDLSLNNGINLKVDILDTAGNLEFPAMRRLSIATAYAILLVYSIDDVSSFEMVKDFFHQIQEQRPDFQEIPIVIAGNKMDVDIPSVEVEFDDVSDWISTHLPPLKTKIVECSAKKGANVKEVFRSFIHLSKIPLAKDNVEESSNSLTCGLKRRLSAHAGSNQLAAQSRSNCSTPTRERPATPIHNKGRSSGYTTPTPSSPSQHSPSFLSVEESPFGRNKPKSRSLIRRCSKKVKKQVQDATEGQSDCQIS